LPGGQGLGEIDDIKYFQSNLYKALNVPSSRLDAESTFSLGRSSEISRDEVKFTRFVKRLRSRFSMLFMEILKTQLILKGILNEEEWEKVKNNIYYKFHEDNYFSELKDSEILNGRVATLAQMDNYIGQFYSKMWVMKNVLQLSEDEIKDMQKEMDEENKEEAENPNPNDPMPPVPAAQPAQIQLSVAQPEEPAAEPKPEKKEAKPIVKPEKAKPAK